VGKVYSGGRSLTSVNTDSGKRKAYFINYGNKKRLHHVPSDQLSSKQLFIIDCQQKFHRQVSNALLAMCISNLKLKSPKWKKNQRMLPIFMIVSLSMMHTPILASLLGESRKVTKSFLNDLLLELFKVVGMKSNAGEFQYKNGRKGCAIIVPKVKGYVSFDKEARQFIWMKSFLKHVAGFDSTEEDAAL
jgi:hypothetical protein